MEQILESGEMIDSDKQNFAVLLGGAVGSLEPFGGAEARVLGEPLKSYQHLTVTLTGGNTFIIVCKFRFLLLMATLFYIASHLSVTAFRQIKTDLCLITYTLKIGLMEFKKFKTTG